MEVCENHAIRNHTATPIVIHGTVDRNVRFTFIKPICSRSICIDVKKRKSQVRP